MANYYNIPLIQGPQSFTVRLGSVTYAMQINYRNSPEGGYTLDISDTNGNPIVQGIPLVTGCDLLAQYKHLGFAGRLWVQTASSPDAAPSFAGLGTDSTILWVTG